MVPIVVSFVYHYTGDGEVSAFVSAELMQRAVSHLLCFYPLFSGRLVLLANGDRQIDRLDNGALFVEVTCNASLRELHEARGKAHSGAAGAKDDDTRDRFGTVLSMFDLPAGSNALFAPFSPTADRIVQDPLFSIQHTRFACGSVAMGVRISHLDRRTAIFLGNAASHGAVRQTARGRVKSWAAEPTAVALLSVDLPCRSNLSRVVRRARVQAHRAVCVRVSRGGGDLEFYCTVS
jgi:hypothetical protein